MQSKWRAPACYVGVGILCALYLSIVPGVSFTDVCAGAGLGAAVMWAINEWETGKWNVALPVQPALAAILPQPAAALAVAGDAGQMQALALQAMPAAVAPAALPDAAALQPTVIAAPAAVELDVIVQSELPDPTPRHRVDSGAPTPEKMEKWELDEKEPSWDATALAETWAKLRAELSINRPGNRQAASPDLPRGSQYARNADAKGQRPQAVPSSGYGRPAAGSSPAAVKFPAAKGAPAKTTNVSIPGRQPTAKPYAGAAPAKPQPVAVKPATTTPAGYTLGSLGQNGGSPVLASLASGGAKTARPGDKPAEPARQVGSFLRSGAFRPR